MSEKGKEFNLPHVRRRRQMPRSWPIFTRQFSVMIDAGLPLVQCLEILAGQQENKTFQKVLTGTRASVEGGATLSAAMRQYPKVFDALYVNMVEAGRDRRYSGHHSAAAFDVHRKERQAEARGEVRLGLPGRRLDGRGGVITLLLWKVVPIFATLFAGLGVDLPLPTRIVIGLSNFVGSIFGLLIVVVVDRRRHRLQGLVRHAARAAMAIDSIAAEIAGAGHPDAKDRRGAVYAHPRHPDLLRRADSRRTGHHRADRGQRGRRESAAAGRKVAGRRQDRWPSP